MDIEKLTEILLPWISKYSVKIVAAILILVIGVFFLAIITIGKRIKRG